MNKMGLKPNSVTNNPRKINALLKSKGVLYGNPLQHARAADVIGKMSDVQRKASHAFRNLKRRFGR